MTAAAAAAASAMVKCFMNAVPRQGGGGRATDREVYSIYEAFDAARRPCDCCCDIRREFNFDFDLELGDAAVG